MKKTQRDNGGAPSGIGGWPPISTWITLEDFETHTYGNKKYDHVIQYHVNHIFYSLFIKETVAVQAQFFKGLLTSRKLK